MAERLCRRGDFLRVQGHGRRFRQRHLVLIQAPGEPGMTRVGFTVSRKVGNAVVRNRVRRRLREIVRSQQRGLGESFDYVIIAQPTARAAPFGELLEDMTWLLSRARGSTPSRPS